VLECGHAIPEVVEALNARLYSSTVYSDGWAQDYSWLAALYDAAHRVPSFRLETLRALLTEDDTARWHLTKQQVSNEMRSNGIARAPTRGCCRRRGCVCARRRRQAGSRRPTA
jgi:hypothetical protein